MAKKTPTTTKALTCTLETLPDGTIRVTSRERGRTLVCTEGEPEDASVIVGHVMINSFNCHRTARGYDMQYIQVNEPVMQALKDLGYVLINA